MKSVNIMIMAAASCTSSEPPIGVCVANVEQAQFGCLRNVAFLYLHLHKCSFYGNFEKELSLAYLDRLDKSAISTYSLCHIKCY